MWIDSVTVFYNVICTELYPHTHGNIQNKKMNVNIYYIQLITSAFLILEGWSCHIYFFFNVIINIAFYYYTIFSG